MPKTFREQQQQKKADIRNAVGLFLICTLLLCGIIAAFLKNY